MTAAFVLGICLVSPSIAQKTVHDAQDAITCEAWTDAAGQQSKLVTQLRDWILHEMRETAREIARANPGTGPLCWDLSCLKDEKLLTALDDYCLKHPAKVLRDAIDNETFVLVELQRMAEQKQHE
jgi:hypothetical protein